MKVSEKTKFEDASSIFKVMAAPVRLEIICRLGRAEKTVGQLTDEVHTSQPNVSQHLAVLEQFGLVQRRKHGVKVFYSVSDHQLASICEFVCSKAGISRAMRAGAVRPLDSGPSFF